MCVINPLIILGAKDSSRLIGLLVKQLEKEN